jgi:hypothetical protein
MVCQHVHEYLSLRVGKRIQRTGIRFDLGPDSTVKYARREADMPATERVT